MANSWFFPILKNLKSIVTAVTLGPETVASVRECDRVCGIVTVRRALSGSELEGGTSGGGEDGVPLRGVVPVSPVYRDQLPGLESCDGALLQQAWHGGTMLPPLRANEVRLWLSVIAYNLGNLWRRLALPTPIGKWSLTSLQQRLVKIGGRLIQHARYYWLLLAESHLTRRLFADMLGKIAALLMLAG
jgi:hypothetical protein